MKKILCTLAVILALFVALLAHALVAVASADTDDPQQYLQCLNYNGVNKLGKNDMWWIGLGRAVSRDSEGGTTDQAVDQRLMLTGLSYRDAD
jgi:hypothetical protein